MAERTTGLDRIREALPDVFESLPAASWQCDCGQQFEIALPAESRRCPACGDVMILGEEDLLEADDEADDEKEEP